MTSTATRETIEELFLHPPINDGDLERRLARVDADEARRLLVTRLASGAVREAEGHLFRAALCLMGIGSERERLIEIALDVGRSTSQRGHALAVLDEVQPGAVAALANRLPPDEMLALGDIPIIDLLVQVLSEPEESEQIHELLDRAPETMRELVFERVEVCRRRVGTPAVLAYDRLLEGPLDPRLRACVLSVLIAEGGEAVIQLIHRQRERAQDPELKRALNGALMRMRTALIDRRPEAAPSGHAFVGSCDGEGAFVIFGCFASIDDTYTRADLCIRTGGEIRDAAVFPRLTADEIEETVEELCMQTGTGLQRVSLAHAAALVGEAVARTEAMGVPLPESANIVLALFHQVAPSQPELPAPAAAAGRKELRSLLERPEYDSWFFDIGDLQSAGPPPRSRPAFKRWLERALTAVDSPEIHRRIVSMLRHMARWHAFQDEPGPSALLLRAAEDCESDFRKSPAVELLLGRAREHRIDVEEEPELVGDATLREHLKLRFFHEVERPRGRDLAQLDFTEAAVQALEKAMVVMPGERRPRQEDLLGAAHLIGRQMGDFFISGKGGPTSRLVVELEAQLAGLQLFDHATWRVLLAEAILPALIEFAEQICCHCPVNCLDAPRRDVAEVFFSSIHPALQRH